MAKLIAAVIAGVVLGILVMLAAARLGPSGNEIPDEAFRDIVDVLKMSPAAAEKHRVEQYINLSSVEEIVSLPTEFARSEALFALAGRSDSAGVQKLIFGANRIADEVERIDLLKILFFRLAETDPQSALALARTDHFESIKSIEQIVWRTWARKDFEEALLAAKTQSSLAHRNSAAQSLYAAFGYMGNVMTERIEAELLIGPDRSSRGRFLYRLADRSPAEAIAFINGLERDVEQQEYVSWLAHYVSLSDPISALGYAHLFAVASDGKRYSDIINSAVARENPQAAIERLLASGQNLRSNGEYYSAIRALASADLDASMRYFEQARTAELRRAFGSAIVSELAKKDPSQAMSWARANDKERFLYLQMSALAQIAELDPQLALTEALNTPNPQMRPNMVGSVVQQIAQNDPALAVAYLDQIQDRRQKLEASQQLAYTWIRQDPEAAIDWILSQDKKTAAEMIRQAGAMLLRSDIDAAISLLPRIGEQSQVSMRRQIAQRLATVRSPGEAQSFIRQFEGQPGYDQLQASVISGVAKSDALLAKQLADQLADSNARDTAYVQVVAQRARTDPIEAARWLSSISDEHLRGTAAGQLATRWYARDPIAAEHWVSNLAAGSSRDDAIMHMSSQWGDPTAEQKDLIASIEDRDKRGQAKIRQIYQIMQTDPIKARELLKDEDIPSYQRQQVETVISQQGLRY